MNRKVLTTLLFVCIACAGKASAQSHDSNHPASLAPGTNKGNVDNTTGPQYYYFYAGPGRIDIRVAFHEMGLFGNPLRQTLSFDFTDEKGKVFYHPVVTSQGNLAGFSNYGNLDTHQRVLVTVTAQQGAIRFGGYYELEVSGVASFEGKSGSSANVKPEDTSLTTTQKNGPVSLTSGTTSLTAGGSTSLTAGTTSLTAGKPVQLVYPGQALTVQDSPRELRILLAADVLFDFDKATLRPDAVSTLRQAAAKMKAAKTHSPILVAGYTDAKGTADLNLRLSQQRADAVDTWFIKNAGLSVSALTPKGYGAAHPVAPNQKPNGQDNPAGRQLNRRVEIVVTK
jgi:outer membrane protein OmpA-like peptidoglycan-associated protein